MLVLLYYYPAKYAISFLSSYVPPLPDVVAVSEMHITVEHIYEWSQFQ